eukprot:1159962-Pelagomonas_calceolata.AAC.14
MSCSMYALTESHVMQHAYPGSEYLTHPKISMWAPYPAIKSTEHVKATSFHCDKSRHGHRLFFLSAYIRPQQWRAQIKELPQSIVVAYSLTCIQDIAISLKASGKYSPSAKKR